MTNSVYSIAATTRSYRIIYSETNTTITKLIYRILMQREIKWLNIRRSSPSTARGPRKTDWLRPGNVRVSPNEWREKRRRRFSPVRLGRKSSVSNTLINVKPTTIFPTFWLQRARMDLRMYVEQCVNAIEHWMAAKCQAHETQPREDRIDMGWVQIQSAEGSWKRSISDARRGQHQCSWSRTSAGCSVDSRLVTRQARHITQR